MRNETNAYTPCELFPFVRANVSDVVRSLDDTMSAAQRGVCVGAKYAATGYIRYLYREEITLAAPGLAHS